MPKLRRTNRIQLAGYQILIPQDGCCSSPCYHPVKMRVCFEQLGELYRLLTFCIQSSISASTQTAHLDPNDRERGNLPSLIRWYIADRFIPTRSMTSGRRISLPGGGGTRWIDLLSELAPVAQLVISNSCYLEVPPQDYGSS